MKRLFPLLSILIALIYLNSQCSKDSSPTGFYFQCKVNGQNYIPDGCANCLTCDLLGDTVLLLGANKGFEAIGIGIIKLNRIPITVTSYDLNQNPQQNADYDNSPLVNDIYKTDSLRTGQLTISMIDKSSKTISGTFYFKAYNAYNDSVVNTTEGSFYLHYSDR